MIVQAIAQVVVLTVLRRRQPELRRPYRQWLYPVPSLLALAGWISVYASAGRTPIIFSIVVMVAGVAAFLSGRGSSASGRSGPGTSARSSSRRSGRSRDGPLRGPVHHLRARHPRRPLVLLSGRREADPVRRDPRGRARARDARSWKGRIWGTANPRFWAHLDPGRRHKPWALVLDVGARVRPVVTPDDADAVLSVLRQRAHGAEIRGGTGGA